MGQKTGHLYKFGPFLLDTAQHVLARQGEPVTLTPKTYDMLLVLVESHGRLLSKEELMKALWPSSFVEESNLTQQISMLRKALGESAGEDRYIVTISGRGYRFAAAVEDCSAQADNVSTGAVRDQAAVAGELSEPNLPSRDRNPRLGFTGAVSFYRSCADAGHCGSRLLHL